MRRSRLSRKRTGIKKFRLVKRKVYTPMGKLNGFTYDLYEGKKIRTRAISHKLGMLFVKKLNKKIWNVQD